MRCGGRRVKRAEVPDRLDDLARADTHLGSCLGDTIAAAGEDWADVTGEEEGGQWSTCQCF